MLLFIARIIGAFASYGKPRDIAFAMAAGFTLALIPGGTFIWFLLFIPLMLIRINQAAVMGMLALGRLFMPLIDPFIERAGFYILTRPGLYEPMGRFLSLPFAGWLHLDNSMLVGGLFTGIAGFPLWFLLSYLLIFLYRRFLGEKIKNVFRKIGGKVPVLKKLGYAVSAGRRVGVV
jgi:uncharacterized protein (TIGR03546 family)